MMDFKKSRFRRGGKKLPIFDPLLPRVVWEGFRKVHPDSLIFTPFFSDMRHEIHIGHLRCTYPQHPEEPTEYFDRVLPQILVAASTTDNGLMGGSWLHVAVRQGDLPLAHECVRLGTSIRHTDRRGYSALYLGCTIIKDLTPDKIDTASFRLPPGRVRSIVSQTIQICLVLLENHAGPNETHDGLSLLGLACLADQWDLIRGLLRHGARSSSPSIPPSQLPRQFLKTEDARAVFDALVSESARKPRPHRRCPCGSGRDLQDCHAQAEAQRYPHDMICPCGSAKIHAQCCVKRKDMYWVEHWDPQMERLKRVAIPKVAPLVDQEMISAYTSMGEGERQAMLRTQLSAIQAVLKDLSERGRVDPAYAAAGCRVLFMPLYPAVVQTISKIELCNSVDLWNEAVDAYIASEVDRRPSVTIENLAKVGPAGGPLYRRCEAVGCHRLEGRGGVKLLRCNGCNTAMYCGTSCQKLAWKEHKIACKSGVAEVQMLPSQIEYCREMGKRFPMSFPTPALLQYLSKML